MLNLFLALLLSSFGASNLSAGGGGDDDTSKLSEAFNRIGRFRRWVKNSVMRSLIYVKDRIVECCRRQISARRGKKLLCFSICFKVTLHTFLHHILFYYPFSFPCFCIYFRLDSNAPAEVQIEATEESDQGVDGNLFYFFFFA